MERERQESDRTVAYERITTNVNTAIPERQKIPAQKSPTHGRRAVGLKGWTPYPKHLLRKTDMALTRR
jgi:hypothetical protein